MIYELKSIAADIAEIKAALTLQKKVLKPVEAAGYMGIKLSTLYKLTSAGILPFSKPKGKLIYFLKEDLDDWLLSSKCKSDAQLEKEAATYISKLNLNPNSYE